MRHSRGMKLLLVEDDAEGAAYLKKALSEAGHTVDHATGGRQGLLLAAGEPYDVIVLDRMLPQMDGLAILRTIRASAVKTPGRAARADLRASARETRALAASLCPEKAGEVALVGRVLAAATPGPRPRAARAAAMIICFMWDSRTPP